MSGRERGKKLLSDLANKVRAQVAPSGEPVLHARGQKAVDDLVHDLSGADAPPGLQVVRDTPDRFRLQRSNRNAQITVEWQRPIGAIVVTLEQAERRNAEVRYLYDEASDEWRKMDGAGELYADIARSLGEMLYPESKR